jgi:plastocyanin
MSVLFLLRSRVSLAFIALGLALVLAVACNGDGDGDGDGDDGGGTTPAGGASAEIQMLPGITFDTDELTIAADADVTITADNTDGFHNFAVYNSRDEAEDPAIEPIGQTEIESAPFVDTVTLNLAAGEYFFRCEVHPSNMTGTLIVQ